jgi:hypothetical protein
MDSVRVPLGNGGVALVSPEDAELVLNWPYSWHENGGYATANADGCKKRVRMHRLIMGNPPCQVDHRNRNRLDNRRDNLRLCDTSNNLANTAGNPGRRKSKFKGVATRNNCSTFEVQIWHRNKKHYIGMFKTALMAAIAYDEAAFRLHGEFAGLNFPERFNTRRPI